MSDVIQARREEDAFPVTLAVDMIEAIRKGSPRFSVPTRAYCRSGAVYWIERESFDTLRKRGFDP